MRQRKEVSRCCVQILWILDFDDTLVFSYRTQDSSCSIACLNIIEVLSICFVIRIIIENVIIYYNLKLMMMMMMMS